MLQFTSVKAAYVIMQEPSATVRCIAEAISFVTAVPDCTCIQQLTN